MSDRGLVLWEAPNCGPIVARIAIAGDFLPAGKFTFPESHNWGAMANRLVPYFVDIGASFVNLEAPLDVTGLRARPLCGLGQTVSASSDSLDYLTAISTKAVSIANNHIYDFGAQGVERTRHAIVGRGMSSLGAGRSLRSLPKVFVWQGPDNIRVGFWAAAKAASDFARTDAPGVEPATIGRAKLALAEIKKSGAQFCVALLHAGVIRTNRPDPEDVTLMDSFAKLGFQIVAASHSHRISGVRKVVVNPKSPSFCFYGLGSLVSGYIAHPSEREGLIVVAGLDCHGGLARLEVRPVLLSESGFGEVPDSGMSKEILTRFHDLSREILDESYARLFYEDVSRGLLSLYARDARSAFRQSGLRGVARKASRVRMRHVRRLVHKVFS